jgi:polysaccharide export outer membrane protein
MRIFFLLIPIFALISGCASRENIAVMQDIEQKAQFAKTSHQVVFKPGDLVRIQISSTDDQAVEPFNLSIVMQEQPIIEDDNMNVQRAQQPFLIDDQGMIQFPVLGALKMGGKTIDQFSTHLKAQLEKFVENPIINIRIVNYRISVLGEVMKPGMFNIQNHRLNILEAISLAGGMKIHARRKNIMVLRRDQDGNQESIRIDLTNSECVNSPVFFLEQNDVVYIEPNKTKMNSSKFGPEISLSVSIASVLIALISVLRP